ncbi:putative bifunctional diguanylate cyclase/phosphodiesterase [Nitrosomonas ureae]|uniref:Diguanylate cyclase (GGDEF) domain-containing protein n=1 Tax=Nitrosomonas ureae TaxID=44577 RepID=A0A286AB80_9PROT|nr:EAL domain-containing protein [Nitrosomonas ureae]SOD19152.1 diguanylate cyclase (GGDEF) domain-containing protein [Nitrosomonas ureae]
MNKKYIGRDFASDDLEQKNQIEDNLSNATVNDIAQRENAVADAEENLLSREKSVTARVYFADLREGVAQIREEKALERQEIINLHEGRGSAPEGLIDSAHQILTLQQANANLVTASIEAHKMTEQIQAAKAQMEHLVYHDILTNLPNRMLLQDRLSQAIDLNHRHKRQLALMFIDLDEFKHINDSLGHAVGDELLRSVAQRLVGVVRHSDTVSRQGGDEFVLLLPYIEHAEIAGLFAQKILTSLLLPHFIGEHVIHIGASIGISIYPDDGLDTEALLKCADSAMYHAKKKGRNNFKFFEQSMNIRAVERQTIVAGLRLALEREEFVLHYQPKINLITGVIVGIEALIRWRHPQRGLLYPVQFVPIAEDCGLILPIGRWVLRQACAQAQVMVQAGFPPITVAINTSAIEFTAKDFFEYIRDTLEEMCLEPCHLEIELTESVLMQDPVAAGSMLHSLADLGVKLAIDDFGTGYSSLSYLRKFPIDTLKIDRSFVSQIINNSDDAAIVSAVINMSKSLRLRVIAEGVETPEQISFLQTQHCDEAQGFYFSRPVAAEALAIILRTGGSLMPNC